jgi:hypothetical protein
MGSSIHGFFDERCQDNPPTEDRAEREWSSFGLHGLSLHGYRMIFHDMALEPQEVSDLLASCR